MVPLPDPLAELAVTRLDLEFDDYGNSSFHTAQVHPFSGAKQLATVAGLRADLDGHYAVAGSTAYSSSFKIKLPKQSAAAGASLQQAVAAGGVTIRWAPNLAWRESCVCMSLACLVSPGKCSTASCKTGP